MLLEGQIARRRGESLPDRAALSSVFDQQRWLGWLDQLSLEVRCGDLFALDVEAIVCTVTVGFAAYGRLSTHVFQHGGARLVAQIQALRAQSPESWLRLGQAVTVPLAAPSPFGSITRVICVALWDTDNPYTPNLIYRVLINALRQAFAQHLRAVAFPTLRVPLPMLADGIRRVLHDLDALPTSDTFSVEEIAFVSTGPGQVAFLAHQLRAL